MSLNAYLWMMRMGVLMAFIAFVFVVIEVDPIRSGVTGFIFFYSSLFLLLAGVFVQFFSWMRRKYSDVDDPFEHISVSFRQGVLLALLAVILLVMQGKGVLVWWDGLLVVVGVFFLELYFLMNIGTQEGARSR